MLKGATGDTLILHGDRDEIVPFGYSARAAEVIPKAALLVVPGQGHGFFPDRQVLQTPHFVGK